MIDLDGEFYVKPKEKDGKGWGATEAARGALAHWVEIENGVICDVTNGGETTCELCCGDGGSGSYNPATNTATIINP